MAEISNQTQGSKTNLKTPIEMLQILLARREKTPTYLSIEDNDQFRCSVSFDDKKVEASGTSKIEAKEAAAKAMVDDLAGCEIAWEFYYGKKDFKCSESTSSSIVLISPEPTSSTLSSPSPEFISCTSCISTLPSPPGFISCISASPSAESEKSSVEFHSRIGKILSGYNYKIKNFVGLLQEYSQIKRIRNALFELEAESGESHDKVFSVLCTMDGLTESRSGKSLKEAKKNAAEAMWSLIEENIVSEEHSE